MAQPWGGSRLERCGLRCPAADRIVPQIAAQLPRFRPKSTSEQSIVRSEIYGHNSMLCRRKRRPLLEVSRRPSYSFGLSLKSLSTPISSDRVIHFPRIIVIVSLIVERIESLISQERFGSRSPATERRRGRSSRANTERQRENTCSTSILDPDATHRHSLRSAGERDRFDGHPAIGTREAMALPRLHAVDRPAHPMALINRSNSRKNNGRAKLFTAAPANLADYLRRLHSC